MNIECLVSEFVLVDTAFELTIFQDNKASIVIHPERA